MYDTAAVVADALRAFQTRAAATGNAQELTVKIFLTINSPNNNNNNSNSNRLLIVTACCVVERFDLTIIKAAYFFYPRV